MTEIDLNACRQARDRWGFRVRSSMSHTEVITKTRMRWGNRSLGMSRDTKRRAAGGLSLISLLSCPSYFVFVCTPFLLFLQYRLSSFSWWCHSISDDYTELWSLPPTHSLFFPFVSETYCPFLISTDDTKTGLVCCVLWSCIQTWLPTSSHSRVKLNLGIGKKNKTLTE